MSLNPWFALLLGILIGWILEWLLEVLFFRRRRLEAQRQLASAEAQLQTRDEELRQAQARITSLEAERLRRKRVARGQASLDSQQQAWQAQLWPRPGPRNRNLPLL
jgi:ABC-type transport system involved in cytochrome bd biosynthesis fused ATPase/permease subunit